MPAKTDKTDKASEKQGGAAKKPRRNILTPPPKQVKLGKSFLNNDVTIETIPEDLTVNTNSESQTESKVATASTVSTKQENKQDTKQATKKNKEHEKHSTHDNNDIKEPEDIEEPVEELQSTSQSQFRIKDGTKGRIISVENVLATHGYKSMEKLLLDDNVIYIRCTNNNGHIVFVDMQGSDYVDETEGDNIILLTLASSDLTSSDIDNDLKTKSYDCVDTELNGVMIIYKNYYLSLVRDGHHLEPKEVTYIRKDGKILRSGSDELLPFPIITFDDILEDSKIVDDYVYNVTDRIYKQFYSTKEKNVIQMVDDINKLSKNVEEFYNLILDKVNYNNDLIYKLETYKDEIDRMEGDISKENRSKLRLILFNLRLMNNIERYNIMSLGQLEQLHSTIKEANSRLDRHKSEYDILIKNLMDQVEEYN